jgi:hypothetical protein
VLQSIAEHDAFIVSDIDEVIDRARARVNGGAHRARGEASALFVAPCDELDRAPRLHPGRVDRFEGFECGEHTVDAVEAPAARLAIHVAAAHDGRRRRLHAFAAHEEVPDCVHAHAEVPRAGPREQQPPRADVFGRKCRAIDAVAGNRADLRHLHVAPP